MEGRNLKDTEAVVSAFEAAVIRKRDGRIVAFDRAKITRAIACAGSATGEFGAEAAKRLTDGVLLALFREAGYADLSVEQVQDIVEYELMASEFKKAAKAYVLYRDQHARIREMSPSGGIELVERYLEKLDWRVRENSNMGYSLQGLNNYIAGQVSEAYWLNRIYTPDVRKAHTEGDLHLHDLGMLSVYCVGWDLADLLANGFKGAAGKVESRPAKHFRSALGQVVNFFYTLQGEAAGAQAFSSFDTLLSPFIRHDKLSFCEVKQALQEFVFNINVPTRVGFQTPFTNISLDIDPPASLRSRHVIIGGRPQESLYGEYKAEMDLFNRALLEVLTEGDAKGRVFTFPIPTYNVTKDFDWDEPVYDYLWKAAARYGIPYFANFVSSDMSPEDARSMCCRLRLDKRELAKKGGGLFGSNPLTGSIGVVTINMPRIGHLAQDRVGFMKRLDAVMEIACTSLETKRRALEVLTGRGLYPYTCYYLRDVHARSGRYWDNHFSTIGLVGMNEACLNLLGKDIGSADGNAFAIEVLDFMREKIKRLQERTGNLYNLEATPAESTSYRLARLDLDRYPDIACAEKDGGEPFYTNSTQLPVNYSDDLFDVLDLQDELQARYTGGTVSHAFIGESMPDAGSVRSLVRKVCENYKLPYFTITPTFSVCGDHGYIAGEKEVCPTCGKATEVYSRVVGYLRPVSQWNAGKQEEFKRRVYFDLAGAR